MFILIIVRIKFTSLTYVSSPNKDKRVLKLYLLKEPSLLLFDKVQLKLYYLYFGLKGAVSYRKVSNNIICCNT